MLSTFRAIDWLYQWFPNCAARIPSGIRHCLRQQLLYKLRFVENKMRRASSRQKGEEYVLGRLNWYSDYETGWKTEELWFDSCQKQEFLLLSKRLTLDLEPTSLLFIVHVYRAPLADDKAAGSWIDHSSYSAGIIEWSLASTPHTLSVCTQKSFTFSKRGNYKKIVKIT
jgi:hypothetical protein